jgi:hypothetical protein
MGNGFLKLTGAKSPLLSLMVLILLYMVLTVMVLSA